MNVECQYVQAKADNYKIKGFKVFLNLNLKVIFFNSKRSVSISYTLIYKPLFKKIASVFSKENYPHTV